MLSPPGTFLLVKLIKYHPTLNLYWNKTCHFLWLKYRYYFFNFMTFNLKCLAIGVNHLPLTPSIWLVVGGVSNYANSISRIPLQHVSSKVMLFWRRGDFWHLILTENVNISFVQTLKIIQIKHYRSSADSTVKLDVNLKRGKVNTVSQHTGIHYNMPDL